MNNFTLNLKEPMKDEENNVYTSQIIYNGKETPIKVNSCEFRVIDHRQSGDSCFMLIEFTNKEKSENLYSFLMNLENAVITEVTEKGKEWFDFPTEQEKIEQLFSSNLKIPLSLNRNPYIGLVVHGLNDETGTSKVIENDSTIILNLIINQIVFMKYGFNIPIIGEFVN